MGMFYFFDLDGTLIDSSHRKAALPCGNLDLEHWIENSTPEKIAADSILPMYSLYKRAKKEGAMVVFITARVLSDADYGYFLDNGLWAEEIISRPDGCTMSDAELKEVQLRMFAHDRNMSWAELCARSVLFDDNPSIIGRLSFAGMSVEDARQLNERMAA